MPRAPSQTSTPSPAAPPAAPEEADDLLQAALLAALGSGRDGIVEGVAKKGATIVTPLSEAPGGWSANLGDPDGHVFSVYQSEEIPR